MKKISFKEKYLIFLIMVCFIVVGLYYSYAIFVTKQLQENVVALKTIESSISLKVNNGNEKIILKGNSKNDVNIRLENSSNIDYYYEIYFKASKSNILVTGGSVGIKNILHGAEKKDLIVTISNNNDDDVEVVFYPRTSLQDNFDKEIGYSYINESNNYDHSGANHPILDNLSLIPVSYHAIDEKNGYWYKTSSNNNEVLWYDYDHGIWANAVLVNDNNYQKYQKMNDGERIEIGDIIGFYVWIPRFKYTILNSSNYTNFERMNNVSFEKENESTGTIRCIDKISNEEDKHLYSEVCQDETYGAILDNLSTYTHPAFRNQNGFWVSKFLIGEGADLRSVPGAKMKKVNIQDAFVESKKVVNRKSHLLSNMEYASIVILSNSSYGKSGNSNYFTEDNYTFKRIYNNNYSYDLTGCSTDYNMFSKGFSTNASKTCISYNDLTNATHIANGIKYNVYTIGPGASTTGTIYGVYDMANTYGEIVNVSIGLENDEDVQSDFRDVYSYNDYQGPIASSSSAINLYRYKLGDAIKENIRTLSLNGMWQGGILEQKEKIGIMLRGGNGEIKNASIYTMSIVAYDEKAPFRIAISDN